MNFQIPLDERIVDFSSGRQFTLVVTNKGKIFGTGNRFKNRIPTSIIPCANSVFRLKMGKYSAKRVYCCKKHDIAFVIATDNTN